MEDPHLSSLYKSLKCGPYNLNFQKAFDMVPHITLVQKLKNFCIGAKNCNGSKAFWKTENSMYASMVTVREVTRGLPQGSVLGQYFLFMYINNLPDMVKSNVCLFADDTKMFKSIKNTEDQKTARSAEVTELVGQMAAQIPCRYMQSDESELNSSARSPSNNRNYFMMKDGNKKYLEKVEQEEDIGVVIASHLSFETTLNQR